jgi:hypothetical protein
MGLQPKELPKQDPVVLYSHEHFTEMDKDRGVEDTIGVEVEVLDPIVLEHPLEEVARREGKSTLHESREHWDLIRILLHQIRISSVDMPKSIFFSRRNPLLTRARRSSVFSFAFFHSFDKFSCLGALRW